MKMKEFLGMSLSEIGVGTYLGNLDEETSRGYRSVMKKALDYGINVIDTAIVYRYMKSERDVGAVLKEVGRDRFVVSTKGGYIPYDADSGADPKDFFYDTFVNMGLVKMEEMTPQGHYLGGPFIDWCFNKSLENMQTDYIDVYFLHNPEEQLNFFPRDSFYVKLRECFDVLEGKVKEGRLKYYGLATWSGFRVSPSSKIYLSLQDILKVAEEVGGKEHHLRFIQLPYNLGMPEAFTLKNQTVNGRKLSTSEACHELGLYVYTSASIYQGNVIGRVPQRLKEFFHTDSDVLTALSFVLHTPGVGTALVGMSKVEHLEENVKVRHLPRLPKDKFLELFP